MKLEILEGGDALFLTLDEVKSWLRVIGDEENELLKSLILAAEQFFENHTDRVLMPKKFRATFLNEVMLLPKSPVLEISKPQNPSVLWDRQTAQILGMTSGEVEFRAGYETIPQIIKIWALNKIASWYENRENVAVGTIVSKFDKSHIDVVLDQFKVRRF